MEFLHNHMAHGHRQRGIGALLGREPNIAEFGHFAKVARYGHGFGAFVAHFGVEVGVGRARHRHVGAPHHQIIAVVPVGTFGHVGLLAPNLRAGGRQVAIPVVKRQRHAANQAQIAGAGSVAHHRHRRNRREADHAVGAVIFHRVGIGCGDDFVGFIPVGTHKAAQAALGFVGFGAGFIFHDIGPGFGGRHGFACFAPHFGQHAAHHRVFHALGGIHIPAVRSATRAAARLVVGQIGAGARIIGGLDFPSNQAVFHINFPAARAGAVHAVGGAHFFIVLPAVAVGVFPLAVFQRYRAVAAGKGFVCLAEEFQSV